MIKLQLNQHFCRAAKIFCRATNFMSDRSDIILQKLVLCIKELQYTHFQFGHLCSVTTAFLLLTPGIL